MLCVMWISCHFFILGFDLSANQAIWDGVVPMVSQLSSHATRLHIVPEREGRQEERKTLEREREEMKKRVKIQR